MAVNLSAACNSWYCLVSSPLYSARYLIIPLLIAPVESVNDTAIKLLNWPNIPSPAGPAYSAITLAERNEVINLMTVDADVNTETVKNEEEKNVLSFDFIGTDLPAYKFLISFKPRIRAGNALFKIYLWIVS